MRIRRPRRTEVTMLLSVGGDYVAGRKYKVKPDEADRLIALGYAQGRMSRTYSQEELAALRSRVQVVSV